MMCFVIFDIFFYKKGIGKHPCTNSFSLLGWSSGIHHKYSCFCIILNKNMTRKKKLTTQQYFRLTSHFFFSCTIPIPSHPPHSVPVPLPEGILFKSELTVSAQWTLVLVNLLNLVIRSWCGKVSAPLFHD